MVTAGMPSLSSYTGSQATKFDLPAPGPVFLVGGDFTTSNIYGTRTSVWMDKGDNNNNVFDGSILPWHCLPAPTSSGSKTCDLEHLGMSGCI